MMEITPFDDNLEIVGDPIKRWTSLSFSDEWEKHGTLALTLRADEFTSVKEAAWIDVNGRTFENETHHSEDDKVSVKITGPSLNVLFDRVVIKTDERLQGNLELKIRALITEYALTGSQKIGKLVLESAQGFSKAIDATAKRGQTLSEFLYSALNQRGFSFRLRYDKATDEIVFSLLCGVDRTQSQSHVPSVLLSTQDALEKANYKKSVKDFRNFAVTCDENADNPQTVEVDLSYGGRIRAMYVSAGSATGSADLGDVIVAVGVNGYIATSTDGVNFTPRTSGTTNTLYSIDYQNGRFIAGGMNGTIVTSLDGSAWTVQNSGVMDSIEGVTYDDGLYLAFCNTGRILYSYDTINWATAFQGSCKTVNAVLTPKQYVAFSSGADTAHKLTSPNGVSNWVETNIALSLSATNSKLLRTCFSRGKIVSAGFTYNGSVYTPLSVVSEDNGISETVHSITSLSGKRFLDLAAGLGLYVAVGQPNTISYSYDGKTWADCTPAGYTIDYISIVFDGTRFYAFGYSSRYTAISEDGKNWTVYANGFSSNIEAAVRGVSEYTASLYAIGVAALQTAAVVETIDGEINPALAPGYEADYYLGDLLDAVDPKRGLTFEKRVLSVEFVNDDNQDAVIPKLGKDFLSLRQYVTKEIKAHA